jgi:hypothetical protein
MPSPDLCRSPVEVAVGNEKWAYPSDLHLERRYLRQIAFPEAGG